MNEMWKVLLVLLLVMLYFYVRSALRSLTRRAKATMVNYEDVLPELKERGFTSIGITWSPGATEMDEELLSAHAKRIIRAVLDRKGRSDKCVIEVSGAEFDFPPIKTITLTR